MMPTISSPSEATRKLIEQARLLSEEEQTQIVEALLFESETDDTDWSKEIAKRLETADANPGVGLTREESEKSVREALRKIGIEL